MMDRETAVTVMQRVHTTTIEVNPEPAVLFEEDAKNLAAARTAIKARNAARVRLLCNYRGFLVRMIGAGLILFTLVAFLLPKRYTATARLMPPDYTSSISTGVAMSAVSGASGAATGGAPLRGLPHRPLALNTSYHFTLYNFPTHTPHPPETPTII